MSDNFFLTINIVTDFFLLLTFLFSLYKLPANCKNSGYIYILSYLFFASFFCIFNELHFYKIITYNIIQFAPLALFHQFILVKFILFEINKISRRSYLELIFYLLIVVQIYFYYFDFINNSFYSASFSNISILLYCIVYFYLLFSNEINYDLKLNYSFLTIVGIFLSTSLISPILLFGKYFFQTLSRKEYHLIASIGPIASLILYLFIFKAVLCMEKKNI